MRPREKKTLRTRLTICMIMMDMLLFPLVRPDYGISKQRGNNNTHGLRSTSGQRTKLL